MGSLPSPSGRIVQSMDFSRFANGKAMDRKHFGTELVEALSTVGFVKFTDHGISEEQIVEVFGWNKQFFGLPLEAKNKAAHPAQPNPHRGYSYVGQEKLSKVKDFEKGDRGAPDVYDIKESYDQGPVDDDMYPNRWPEEADIPGFRDSMESFYSACHAVHLQILEALAIGLDFPSDFFQQLFQDNKSELRLNHYPACEAATIRKGAMRISEHTDFGTVTLLFQDSVGGLEIEDQSCRGAYFPVPCLDKFQMIVNIGDCLSRWTNDKFRSTSHRVVLPPDVEDWVEDRYSVAYFAKPSRTQSVGPLPEFLKEGKKPRYEYVSAWEFNQQKLTLTY